MDSSSKAQFNLRLRDIGTMRQTRQGDYFTAREQYIAERDDLSEYEEMKEKFNLPKMNRAKGTMKSSDLWSKKERRQFLQEVLIRNNKIPIPQNYERLTAKEIFYKKRGLLSYQKEPTSPQRRGDMSERKSPSRSPKAAATQYHFNLKRLEQTASKESATKRSIFTPRDVRFDFI